MAENLGQVSSVHIGTQPPANTLLIWAKTTTDDPQTWEIISFYVYDTGNAVWKDLDISAIAMTRLVDFKEIPDAAYTFVDSDLGKVLIFTNNGGVVATVPEGLMDKWQCVGIYSGTGIFTLDKEANVTLKTKNNALTLTEENDPFWLAHKGADVVYGLGDFV